MIKKRILSNIFILLYLLFLGNANLYAYTSINEVVSSCCSEEETSCCGSCTSDEESSNTDIGCCQGNGCCGWQETRIPSTIYYSESSQEVKDENNVQVRSIQIFNKASFYTLNFHFVPVEKFRLDFYPKRNLICDRLSSFSIWHC